MDGRVKVRYDDSPGDAVELHLERHHYRWIWGSFDKINYLLDFH